MASNFVPGASYSIDYGFFKKVATFVRADNGNNVFFDNNGEFIFTDAFLASGAVTVEELGEG